MPPKVFSDDENGSSFQAPRSTLVNILMIADTYRYTYVFIYIYIYIYAYIYISIHKMVIICIYIYTFLYVFIFISGIQRLVKQDPPKSSEADRLFPLKASTFFFFVFVATSGKLTKPLKALGFVASRCFFWPSNCHLQWELNISHL